MQLRTYIRTYADLLQYTHARVFRLQRTIAAEQQEVYTVHTYCTSIVVESQKLHNSYLPMIIDIKFCSSFEAYNALVHTLKV